MSERWRGLHNPERHNGEFLDRDIADCSCCECRYCAKDAPCRCCLAAEVAALTLRAEKAEAAIARVRELCQQERHMALCYPMPGRSVITIPVQTVLDALDEVTA